MLDDDVVYDSGSLTLVEQKGNNAIYRWTVRNPSNVEKLYSDPFEVGATPWRILVFPRGNGVKSLSVYLDVANAHALQDGWTREASFSFKVIHLVDDAKTVSQSAQKVFCSGASDWGFQEFMPLSQVHTANNGFVVNDELVIEVEIMVIKGPPPEEPLKTTSERNETGCVGIKNQGATCYLNSLIQTFFHLSYLRHAVYSMPIADDDKTSIPAALQRVFYELQYGEAVVGTQELTQSFGWDSSESFKQHDIQELNRKLCENLEGKMKAPEVAGTMDLLFKGVTTNVVQCVNIDFESRNKEAFYDLQLNVKGCKNIYDAFEQYVAVEMLDGDNKYLAEGKGLQAAKKFSVFSALPNVLILHLKRFEFDYQTSRLYKVNDRYEFYTTLSIDRFVDGSRAEDMHPYVLFSVLVHSGGVNGGHYCAFIKPAREDSWFKFDDERVTRVTEQNAIADNFGGPAPGQPGDATSSYSRTTNAYMLVYIRKSSFQRLLFPVAYSDIPQQVHDRFENERRHEEEIKKDAAEAHIFVLIKLVTPSLLLQHKGFDLIDFTVVPEVKVRRLDTYEAFTQMVQGLVDIPPRDQQFWKFEGRLNGSSRPSFAVRAPTTERATVEKVFFLQPKVVETLQIFVHRSLPGSERMMQPRRQMSVVSSSMDGDMASVLLFFKVYHPATTQLNIIGLQIVSVETAISDLNAFVISLVPELGADTTFDVYEEVCHSMLTELNSSLTVSDADLGDGDVLVFQAKRRGPQNATRTRTRNGFGAINDFDLQPPCPTATSYSHFMVLKQTVKFCHLAQTSKIVCTLDLTLDMPISEVRHCLATHLELDASFIQLTGQTLDYKPRRYPFREDSTVPGRETRLLDMVTVCWSRTANILYYEVLPTPLHQRPPSVTLHVDWYTTSHTYLYTYRVVLHRDDLVADLLQFLLTTYLVADPKLIMCPPLPPAPSHLGWPAAKMQAGEAAPDIPVPPDDDMPPATQTSGSPDSGPADPPSGTNSVDCGGKGGSLDGGAKGKKTNVLWVASSTPPPLPEGAAAPAPKEQGSCTSSNSSTASNGAAPGPACNGAAAPGTGRAAGGSGSNSRGSSPLRTSIGSSPKGGLKKRHGSFTGGFRSGLRLMEVSDRQHRIMTVFDPHDPLSMLEDHPHWSLRAEVIPPAQVVHFNILQSGKIRMHGTPFIAHLTQNDTTHSLRKRLAEDHRQAREIRDVWGFYVIHSWDQYVKLEEDEKVVAQLQNLSTVELEACIGMEHADNQKGSTRTGGGGNKGITING